MVVEVVVVDEVEVVVVVGTVFGTGGPEFEGEVGPLVGGGRSVVDVDGMVVDGSEEVVGVEPAVALGAVVDVVGLADF